MAELTDLVKRLAPAGLRSAAPKGLKQALRAPFKAIDDQLARFDLEKLGRRHGSDKLYHGYLPHYQRHLKRYRTRPVTVLEIGVGGYADPLKGGGSLRLWADYFPNGRIHGVDIEDKSAHDVPPRIKTHKGDQTDAAFLGRVIDEIGAPDIIIDDGSHINRHLFETFDILFPRLRPDGIYILEDLHTAYLPSYGGDYLNLNSEATSIQLLRRLTDSVNWKSIPGRVRQPTDGWIKSLSIYPKTAVVEKGVNDLELIDHEIELIEAALR